MSYVSLIDPHCQSKHRVYKRSNNYEDSQAAKGKEHQFDQFQGGEISDEKHDSFNEKDDILPNDTPLKSALAYKKGCFLEI